MPVRDDVIHISMRGRELAGTLISPAPRMPAVLMVHGWGGSQRQYRANAHKVAALGCVCLTFDLTGHVATASQRDTVSREENLHDMLAAYDFLAAHPLVEHDCIAVVGSSYGGYLAALLTERRPVRWLGLRAPAIYRDEDWGVPKRLLARVQKLADYRREPLAAEDNRALRACSRFTGDVLIVESEHDEIVPSPAPTTAWATRPRAKPTARSWCTGWKKCCWARADRCAPLRRTCAAATSRKRRCAARNRATAKRSRHHQVDLTADS